MIQLDETFFNQPMWKESRVYSKAEAWLCMLKEADKPIMDIMDGYLKLSVGQGKFYTSYKALSYSFRWTTPKIIKYIKTLMNHGVIDVEQISKTKSIIIDIKEISRKYKIERDLDMYQANKPIKEITRYKQRKKETSKSVEPVFDFGKYNGLRISKCKDIQYLKWVYRYVDLDEFVRFAVEVQIDKLEMD